MSYIKQSFKRTFLPILIYHFGIFLLTIIFNMENTSFLLYWYINNSDVSTLLMDTDNYRNIYFMYADYLGLFYALLVAVITSPIQIGLYGYCFERLNDEYTSVGAIFDFYKGPKKIFSSVIVKNFTSVLMCITVALMFVVMTLIFGNSASDTSAGIFPSLNAFSKIVIWLASMAVLFFFFLSEYRYAAHSEEGVQSAVFYAVKAAKKNWLKIVAVILLLAFINNLLSGWIMKLALHFSLIGKCGFIFDTLTMWIGITFAHSVFEDEVT
ncbi:MAG: hypothetical protein IJC04_01020 [Oscillospiraceae bacterium]|nr:hypothetical protein [Oscillospiraceae bacterium]